jgi:hypothetical protein
MKQPFLRASILVICCGTAISAASCQTLSTRVAGSAPSLLEKRLGAGYPQTDISVPDVIVLEPESSPVTTAGSNFKLRALVRSRLPLLSVAVTLNGKIIHRVKLEESPKERNRYVLEVEIPLTRGKNTVAVTANNAKTSSQPQIREILYEPVSQNKPNLIVLAVGISSYAGSGVTSRTARDDAEALAKILSSQANEGGLYQSVKTNVLIDEQATRLAIFKSLDWLNAEAKFDDDVRLVFLSGHFGAEFSNSPYFLSSESPKGDPALYGVSYSVILDKLSARPVRTIIFIDGQMDGRSSRALLEITRNYAAGITTYLASLDDKKESDTPAGDNSIFVKALLEGLRGRADLEVNGSKDGVVDTAELRLWLEKRVAELSEGRQRAAYFGASRPITFFKLSTAVPPR